jgi:hypothetical protein
VKSPKRATNPFVGNVKLRTLGEVYAYSCRNPQVAVTGVYVYRETAVGQLTNKLIFGDNPSGELF